MLRVKISAAVLSTLIILSSFTCVWINIKCQDLLEGIDEIRLCIDKNDTAAAAEAVKDLSDDWNSFKKKASVTVKSDWISEIDRVNSRLLFLLENSSDELESELTEMRSMITLMRTYETPYLTSVL